MNILSFPCRNGCDMLLTPENGMTEAAIQNWHNGFCEEFEEGPPIMDIPSEFQMHLYNKYGRK